ncbi:16S rRNA (cytidine(1402)-2'-O)-methyltransferase [Actinomyces sp. 2119]|uniref:Ribosomal RNA small subunit methyltransferase I n=1 Tax=Actinomyces lilanjuaniae TaxID=2321394 RepID=A0ABN5PRJ0_9ACTO|nr:MULTISPECIES: 16S rRNA (cytidine(1402)-2'-O)-methyltransferase [Actinomyces]AYD90991.1 16S rRNA (cytidine(1402)-2'-O)-methyltransferase [Actinomyces lilanjuaniae]RJF40316.1 16S rRNA (cytidine(1402)-2'-O)-methyltransferase [Actinomyces sp. 2119]
MPGGGPGTQTASGPRPGTITLAATPIGHADDASLRLRSHLESADLLAAEDTRRLTSLVRRLDVVPRGRVVSLYEHNESARAADLVAAAQEGRSVVVVSDAGMPAISDPGYRLVVAAAQAGVPVTVIPGPSAVLTALVLSGLPTDRFCFEGFLPRKDSERRRVLHDLAGQTRTMVFFESPRRVGTTLQVMAEVLGADRPAALCREMTKTFEEVLRADLGDLARLATDGVRGEVVLVVAGARPPVADTRAAAREALALAEDGMRLKEAAAQVAREVGLRPNEVYRAALACRGR